jgi:hypothetical protein
VAHLRSNNTATQITRCNFSTRKQICLAQIIMNSMRGLFVLLGLSAVIMGLRGLLRARHARRWRSVRGQILKSEIAGYDDDRIVVRYRYRIGTRDYEGDRWRLSGFSDSRAPEIIKRYAVGASVRVFYNPMNPQESALERDPPGGPLFFVVLGTLFALMGLFMPLD